AGCGCPAGSRCETCTFVAASGPASASVTVTVTVPAALAVGSLTDLVRGRSARCGATAALPWSLPGSGSNWSLWLTDAVLVAASAPTTRARICSVSGAAVVTVPTAQTAVALG